LKEEKLRGYEFRHRSRTEEEVHIYELEKGSFLGEDDGRDVDGRLVESFMDCQESSYQHMRKVSEASEKTMWSYVFKTKY
jgi:hypothetical protein